MSQPTIAVFFEIDEAQAALARLEAGGWTATLRRSRFAGEDDDEDQPWTVHTDAPEFLAEVLVEEYGGWLERDEPAPASGLELPAGPRRHHRPEAGGSTQGGSAQG